MISAGCCWEVTLGAERIDMLGKKRGRGMNLELEMVGGRQTFKPNRRGTYHRKRRRWTRTRHIINSTRAGGFSGLVVASSMDLVSVVRRVGPGSLARVRSACLDGHRKASSSAITLPSHYTLPSGDRIPAVALGALSHRRIVFPV